MPNSELTLSETKELESEGFEATELNEADLEDVAGGLGHDPENGTQCNCEIDVGCAEPSQG